MSEDKSEDSKLDVVVYGATGFTGKLVCEYLQERYAADADVSWGMAGRNADKLAQVRDELGISDSVTLIVADSEDKAAVDAMVASAKVVLTTAGPYQKYGSTVVESCARLGTDYVDLSGEPLWMKEMIDAHEATAQASGARIVFSCGFDSLPSDLGVHFLQKEARARFGEPLPRVRCRVKAMSGSASGGTVASFTATMGAVKENPALFADLANPFVLANGFTGPEQPEGNQIIQEEDLNNWSGPFVMATINTKVVHRSNALLAHAYGEDLVYDEMIFLGESKPEAAGGDLGFDMSLQPGDGPSKEEREAGFYEILYIGSNDAGESLTVVVNGDRDPGYGSTSKMIAEAAICLSQTPNAGGGVFTAAPVMGDALRERLHNYAGVTYEVA